MYSYDEIERMSESWRSKIWYFPIELYNGLSQGEIESLLLSNPHHKNTIEAIKLYRAIIGPVIGLYALSAIVSIGSLLIAVFDEELNE